MYLTTAAEMRGLDASATEVVGIPSLLLMENAGRSIAESILMRVGDLDTPRVVILAGPGNNGGDGFVIARHLFQAGAEVYVILSAEADRIAGDARTNLNIVEKLEIPVVPLRTEADFPAVERILEQAEVLVDALLGIGVDSEVRGPCQLALEVTAGVDAFRVAVDIPTGVHADTGQIMGDAFLADLTVTCGLPKHGVVHFPGAGYSGEIEVAEIGIPHALIAANAPRARVLVEGDLLLPDRPTDSHKGTFGHLLILGGAPGKTGASLLAAKGAFGAGAGLVTLATDAEARAFLDGKAPEVMIEVFREFPDTDTDLAVLQGLVKDRSAIVVGPGLGNTTATLQLVEMLMAEVEIPVVLDADALNAVAESCEVLRKARGPLILTPHPGEMGRLLSMSIDDVQGDRPSAARMLAERTRAYVVLKGAHTIVSDPTGSLSVVLTGNPGMAAAGCGDVLAGILGALVGRLPPRSAVELGVYLHGLSGDLGADEKGMESLRAGDVADFLPAAWSTLENRKSPKQRTENP